MSITYWPESDSDEYGSVADVAIGLILAAGFANDESKDNAGSPVSEDLQTLLMDVMFRAPRMEQAFRSLESIMTLAIVSNLDANRR